ncbi:hypothetical protein BDP27DRAFT_1323292 [Rhodocollybia butyracea]|uniref:Uncharacterized protein n=1 Tax=Rhodocollybia butyracea TaxID=206335 RepID=A0A9P5PR82_9AGAR|nr:hypothetical protein BDP27DRAFT_1323292 [Rhodocollybia butyracea]
MSIDYIGKIQERNNRSRPRPPPKYRHSSPSGPWPWVDPSEEVDENTLIRPPPQPTFPEEEDEYHPDNQGGNSSKSYWSRYPQSKFANWTQRQQQSSGIANLVNRRARHAVTQSCRIFKLDVFSDGIFHANNIGSTEGDYVVKSGQIGSKEVAESHEIFWKSLEEMPHPKARVRAYFIDNLSGPALQMFGTKFNIEPFFFSSSLNSIPSRFQSQARPGKGDHITLTLSFVRMGRAPSTTVPGTPIEGTSQDDDLSQMLSSSFLQQPLTINVESPLVLTHDASKKLVPDLLSLHIIRKKRVSDDLQPMDYETFNGNKAPVYNRMETDDSTATVKDSYKGMSTIISYHMPSDTEEATSAAALHMRLLAAGRSVYWSNIFASTVPSGDPTFVALSLLWYPLYAWDEVFDALVGEVSFLETQTLYNTDQDEDVDNHDLTTVLTNQLHVTRAHLLHYEQLLIDFRKTVEFVLETAHPGLVQSSNSLSSPKYVSPSQMRALPRRRQTKTKKSLLTESRLATTGQHYSDPSLPVLPDTTDEAPAMDTLNEESGPSIPQASHGPQSRSQTPPRRNVRLQTGPTEYERLLHKECTNLLNEIDRLEMTRDMLNNRLGNVMELAFNSVNIEDSKQMKDLAEATVRDGAAMKQISYLTMIFLPGSFIAAVFGMNIEELNDGNGTLPIYIAIAIPLTAITIWVMMMQYQANKRRSKTTASDLLNSIRMDPMSFGKRFWHKIWYPLRAFLNALSLSGSSRRRKEREAPDRTSWIAPSPGTSLRIRPSNRPMLQMEHLESGLPREDLGLEL